MLTGLCGPLELLNLPAWWPAISFNSQILYKIFRRWSGYRDSATLHSWGFPHFGSILPLTMLLMCSTIGISYRNSTAIILCIISAATQSHRGTFGDPRQWYRLLADVLTWDIKYLLPIWYFVQVCWCQAVGQSCGSPVHWFNRVCHGWWPWRRQLDCHLWLHVLLFDS